VRGSRQNGHDGDPGPMVRLYAMTRGRARAHGGFLDIIALVVANTLPEHDMTLTPEQAAILELCGAGQLSVAEIAVRADLPLNVVRVLLSDLLDAGHVQVVRPAAPQELSREMILREVIDGLRAL
jgi:hypothetical protein